MRKLLPSIITAALIMTPVAGFAQTTTTTTNQALLNQIADLLKQLNTLQTQINSLKTEQKELASDLKDALKELRSEMDPGSKGEMVEVLQALLASDPSIFPEGQITGFFGPLTKKAVQRFQKKHGLSQVGRVGPKTLEKLNDLLKKNPVGFETASSTDDDDDNSGPGSNNSGRGSKNSGKRLCAHVPPGHLIAPGWLKKHGGDRPVVPACQTLPPGIAKKINASSTATSTPPASTSTPDTIAPAISGISVSASTTMATISWTTNESATGKVYWSSVSPVDINSTSTASVTHAGSATNHNVNITGLTASTTYYYVIESVDAAGNKATSTQQSFVTNSLPAADTTAPVISGVTLTASSTSATVAFTTNEAATGKIYYGTVTPLSLVASSTLSISGSSGVTSHSIPFSGLTASTTYFYVVEAKDAANNTATTAESSFVTTQ